MYPCLKRLIDISSAIFLAVLFFPIWIIIPVITWLDSGRPIFYKHKRVGKNGREFNLYKFRTMIKDADEVLYEKDKKLLKKFKAGDWEVGR